MFSTANISNGIRVYEAMNGFYIENLWCGKSKSNSVQEIGDGVGMFFDAEDKAILVGTREFYMALKRWIQFNGTEIREAYFG